MKPTFAEVKVLGTEKGFYCIILHGDDYGKLKICVKEKELDDIVGVYLSGLQQNKEDAKKQAVSYLEEIITKIKNL